MIFFLFLIFLSNIEAYMPRSIYLMYEFILKESKEYIEKTIQPNLSI